MSVPRPCRTATSSSSLAVALRPALRSARPTTESASVRCAVACKLRSSYLWSQASFVGTSLDVTYDAAFDMTRAAGFLSASYMTLLFTHITHACNSARVQVRVERNQKNEAWSAAHYRAAMFKLLRSVRTSVRCFDLDSCSLLGELM